MNVDLMIFFVALCEVMQYVRNDYYLSLHANYYLREIRLRSYQFFFTILSFC